MYSPGIVGLNNIKANDYCNVILQVIYYTNNINIYINILLYKYINNFKKSYTYI